MSIFNFFRATQRKSVADEAKERLQIVLAHERAAGSSPDYLPLLQRELLEVIKKYVKIEEDKVEVKLDRGGDCSTLEVNIELPAPANTDRRARAAQAAGKPAAQEAAKPA